MIQSCASPERTGRFLSNMTEKTTRITHPFEPIYDEKSRILILGSLPSEKSRKEGFYYMNPRNRFWKLLSLAFAEPFPEMNAKEKSDALLRHGIALSDVVLSCEIYRSADSSIRNVEYTDIPSILQKSKVQKILLNGAKAHALFLKRFPEYAAIAFLLPSTSPANAKCGMEDLLVAWRPHLL